jgi:tetratricopeptide (TPR) repeat protein
LRDNDRKAFILACESIHEGNPDHNLAEFYLGILYEAQENWIAAETHFQNYLQSGEQSKLTEIARKQLATLNHLKSTPTQSSDAKLTNYYRRLALAKILMEQGMAKEALLEAASASKERPERWEAYATASAILVSQSQFDQAEHFFVMAKERVPASDAAKLHRLEGLIGKRGRMESPTANGP